MHLSIVIVTFNSSNNIQACLESVYANFSNNKNNEIIVVDNFSSDNTVNIIQSFKNRSIKLIKNLNNEGYARAINIGVEKSKYSNILILNPDIILSPNAVSCLLSILSKNKLSIVGPKLINADGSFQLSSRRHFPTFSIILIHFLKLNKMFPKSKIFGRYNYTFIDEERLLDVDSTTGACMMFGKETYSRVNGFDDTFFMYFEDTDFCTRVKEEGGRIIYCPEAEAIHSNDYRDNYNAKMDHFYDSFYNFIRKHSCKIYFAKIISFLVNIIRRFSYLKRILYFNYNYKINNE